MQHSSAPFTIRPLSYAAGAEIIGLDLRDDLPESTIEQLKDVWGEYLILLFRNQPLTPDQQIAFTSRFGALTVFDGESLDGYPQILRVTNKTINGRASGTREAGRSWHADQTFTVSPALGSFFACKEKPPVGGDTLFANMCRAFETLSPTLQAILEGLEAVHDYNLVAGNAAKDPAHVARMKQKYPPVRHRVVMEHPRTHRKALLVGDRVSHFHGMNAAESQPLLRFYH